MKSKYAIMRKEFKKSGREMKAIMLKFVPKLLSAKREIEKANRLNTDMSVSQSGSIIIDIMSLLSQLVPGIRKVSHIQYENIRDLEKIDRNKLQSYMESKGIDYTKFAYKYSEQLKSSVRVILLFSLMDRENIGIVDLNSLKIADKLMDGGSVTDIVDEIIEKFSPHALDLCSEVFNDDDFDPRNLPSELAELLETSHNDFMNQHIYSQVTNHSVSEQDVLKLSKKLI